jgi:hypothetical protein
MGGGVMSSLNFNELVENMAPYEREHAVELSQQLLFMRDKLQEMRRDLQYQDPSIPYDNGGGQTGIRENPAFVAYEKLLKSYESALLTLRQMLGIDKPKHSQPVEKPKSNLEKMRGKYAKLSMVSSDA